MKLTKFKEIFKNIRSSTTNFISITMFIFLGVAIFQSFDFSGNGIKIAMDNAFREQDTYDIQIPYVLGCSKENINKFLENEHISYAEGYYSAYEYLNINGNIQACKIHSLTKDINKTKIIEGRLPEADNEIAILNYNASVLGIHTGDHISFSNGNGLTNYLMSQLRDITTRDDLENIKNDSFSNFITNDFEVVGLVSYPEYFGKGPIYYGTFPNSAVQVQAVGFVNYTAFNPKITNGYYNTVLLRSDEVKNLNCTEDEYSEKVNNIINSIRPIAQSINDATFKTCSENINAVIEISDLVEKIADYFKIEIEKDTEEEVRTLIEEYLHKLTKVETVSLISRAQNLLLETGMMPVNATLKLKYSLGGIFIFISLLISLSTINRLIGNDIKLIGTKKAFGIKKRELLFTYSGYTLLAALVGLVLGNIFALVFESILTPKLGCIMLFDLILDYVNVKLVILLSAIVLTLIELMTIIGCLTTINKNTVDLLKGDIAREHGKVRFYEKGKLWSKLPLVNKTIINNAVNEKKRCLSTIVGIASITCMIVGSITMNRNVINAFEKEKSDYFRFDYFVFFDPTVNGVVDNMLDYFETKELNATAVNRELVYLNVGENKTSVAYTLVYFDEESFDSVISIDSTTNNKFEHHGLWLAESIKKGYGAKENDVTKITTASGEEGEMQIEGYYKNYSYIVTAFMSAEEYYQCFNIKPSQNNILVNLRNVNKRDIEKDLKEIDGFVGLFNYESLIEQSVDAFASVADVIVTLYLIVSILMGIFVILNLLIAFVNEKKRELITLMINGYSFRKTCQYIYADTIFLTIIGLIVGVASGIGIGSLTISAFESKTICLPHGPNLFAILIGCGVTIALMFVIVLIALRKIKTFKLTDINSSSN